MLINCDCCGENQGLRMFIASECLRKYFLFCSFHCLQQFFSHGNRFTHITYTGNMCNNSYRCGCYFSTMDINAHFRILFIAKFKILKLHSKVCLFKRMFKLNQVHLGPSTYMHSYIHTTHPLRTHAHYSQTCIIRRSMGGQNYAGLQRLSDYP